MRIIFVGSVLLSVLLSGTPFGGPGARPADEVPVLVSTEWLAARLGEPDIRVLHVGMGHERRPDTFIPGSGFLDYHGLTANERGGLIMEMQPVATMVDALRAAGVSSDSHVVLYGHPQHLPARAFVVLELLGHERVSVLDGGLRVWSGEGRPTTSAATDAPAGDFAARPRDDVLVDRDWIQARLADPKVALVDARPAIEYTGDRVVRGTRGGHIPGAANIYWEDLLASESMPRLLDIEQVRARYADAGAREGGTVVSYCYIGMRASYTYLISRHLGFETRFYDGSWNDWSQAGLPAETGASR